MAGSAAETSTAWLLERDRELERLDAALAGAREETGALVLIEGSAGIGKTELVLSTQRRAREAGIAVASARGSELERELAFGIVRQLLEPVVAGADPKARAELFDGAATLAEPLFSPAGMTEPGPGGDQTFSILHGLYWLCANLAQARPLLLSVDDAHWADLASLRFLAYLGPRLEGLPLVLLVAARPAEAVAEEELLGRLGRDPRAATIAPAPLSAEAVSALIAADTGRRPEAEFAEACRRATGGVPLLVRELVRALAERGIEPVAASAGEIGQIGPRTIARYVVARVRRIAPDAEGIARTAAVLGGDAELPRVTRLAGVEDEAVALGALDALARAGVISSTRPIEFAHPVVRAAIYGDLAPGERSGMHARAAALLAEERVEEERIASHLLAATPTGDQGVVDLLVRTARAASARGAPGSAAAYLERALAEPPEAGSRGLVLHELGVAEFHSGDVEHAQGHLSEAHRLADPGRERALIAQMIAGCLRLRWRHQEAFEVIADALEELDPDDDLALALSAELLLLVVLEPHIHTGTEAGLMLDAPTGTSLGAAKYLAALTADAVLRMRRPAAEARALAARSRDAGIADDLAHGGSLWINAVAPLIIADGFELAGRMLADAFDAARRRASTIFTTRAYVTRSMLRFRQGALHEALVDAEAALATVGETGFVFPHLSLGVLVEAECERGDLDAAEGALARMGIDAEIPDTFIHNWVLQSRGRLRLAQGRIDEAIGDFEELGRRNERRGFRNPAPHAHRSGLAEALLRRGEADRARVLAADEADLARGWGAPRALGISLRTLGRCEGGESGIARLRESVEVLESSGAELEYARSLVELGAAIRRSGTRSEAREPLRVGMELAHHCGAAVLMDQAREELLATGARPRRIMRTGIDALTPSELRVARMAAEGMTNREIAQALFVTARTVEGHLTHAFQKLDISSRGELETRLSAESDG